MTNKFPLIKSIALILQIIWYLQLIFISALIIISLLIAIDSPIVEQYKLKGFSVQFHQIDLSSQQNDKPVYISNGIGRLHNTNAEKKFIFYRIFSVFTDALLYTFIVFWLRKILNVSEADALFTKKNGEYITKIAYAVLGIALLPAIINYYINLEVVQHLKIEHITFKARLNIDFRTLFLAMLIFIIAKVFVKGAELKEENDLTI